MPKIATRIHYSMDFEQDKILEPYITTKHKKLFKLADHLI